MQNPTYVNDTIVALTTPPGKGGVAVIRVSGQKVVEIIKQLFGKEIPPRHAYFAPFCDASGNLIDEGIALFFPNPNSFTGEDVLELQGHGGPVLVDLLLKHLVELGARLAKPGEFSERAFLNDKIDLTQAEAIADLIDAASETAVRSALRSLQGEFAQAINTLAEQIMHIRLYVEAAIDFADEEIDFLKENDLHDKMLQSIKQLKHIKTQAKQGSLLREGVSAIIVGAPNVGKSSLLNTLSGKELAIVTEIPGTTRDILRDVIMIDGMPLHILDTAGIRESQDLVELEGIRRAQKEMQQADLILYMTDASEHSQNALPIATKPHQKVLMIRNKIDLIRETPQMQKNGPQTCVSISIKNQQGLLLLKEAIKDLLGYQNENSNIYLARRRHLDALDIAEKHLEDSLINLEQNQAGELVAEDLRLAQQALGEITGRVSSDDLLGKIFSTFCIGK